MRQTGPETDASTPPDGRGRVRRRLTADEIRQRRRRLTNWIVSIGLGVVLVNALVGENGYLATLRAAREEAALRAEIAKIRIENARLQKERERLQHDKAAVEEAGRALGMIRDGETVVTIKRPSQTPPSAPAR